jgi:acetylornithine deacetylase/succinyl-diaminopimelate desuccinylase-like protein
VTPAAVLAHAAARFDGHLARVQRWVRQPSVSATGEGMTEMAELVRADLAALGFDAAIRATDGWPIVTGTLDEGQPRTLLVYGMYDVQPVAGERWSVAPFGGELVDLPRLGPSLVARGVYNSKGPLAGTLAAIESVRDATGRLPVNLKVLVEGEEELASRSLPAFLRAHATELRSDGIYGPFYGQNRRGTPIVKLGFKGVQFAELVCTGGAWGGPGKQAIHGGEAAWIANPAWQLVRTLATLVDERDRPAIAGLRAGAPRADDEVLAAALAPRFSPDAVLEQQQVARWKHDGDAAAQLRHYLFDSVLNLDGLVAGHTSAGTKSLVPHEATAKLSLRLVPGMELGSVRAALSEHVARVSEGTVDVRFAEGYPPSRIAPDEPMVRALLDAFVACGTEPEVWPIHGGSAPFSIIGELLGAPFLPGGLGHGGKQHAPDEYATIAGMKLFERGVIELLYRFAAIR